MKTFASTMAVARGLTVCCMPAIHTVMLFSHPSVHHAWWVYPLRLIAEGPGAQLFMWIMGFLVATSHPKSLAAMLRRGGWLLLSGYFLNCLRIYLPARVGWLPSAFLQDYGSGAGTHPYLPLLLVGDILQFAGIAYAFLGLLQRFVVRCVYIWILGCSLYGCFAIGGLLCWQLRSSNLWIDHVLALMGATDRRAFFPLFPWLCYPISGWLMGKGYTNTPERTHFRPLLWIGVPLFILGIIAWYVCPANWEGDFYRSGPGRTIANTGFVFCWLYGVYQCTGLVPPNSRLLRWFCFCSRHINRIYWIHWLLLSCCFYWLPYHGLTALSSVVAILLVSGLSFGLTYGTIKATPSLDRLRQALSRSNISL